MSRTSCIIAAAAALLNGTPSFAYHSGNVKPNYESGNVIPVDHVANVRPAYDSGDVSPVDHLCNSFASGAHDDNGFIYQCRTVLIDIQTDQDGETDYTPAFSPLPGMTLCGVKIYGGDYEQDGTTFTVYGDVPNNAAVATICVKANSKAYRTIRVRWYRAAAPLSNAQPNCASDGFAKPTTMSGHPYCPWKPTNVPSP
jgi:hypothetical protein